MSLPNNDFLSSLFYYLFAVEVLVSEFVFLIGFERKNKIILRWLIVIIAIFAFRFLCSLLKMPIMSLVSDSFDERMANNVFLFIANASLIVASAFSMCFCYKGSVMSVVSFATSAEVTQHFASKLFNLITIFVTIPQPWSKILEYLVEAVIFAASYFLFVKHANTRIHREGGNIFSWIFSFVIIMVCIGVNRASGFTESKSIKFALDIYAMLFCVSALLLRYIAFDRNEYKKEIAISNQIIVEQSKQYNQWKASLEQINIHYHDLKHELNSLKEINTGTDYSRIEKILNDYDSVIHTGNDMLDVLISGKKMVCNSKGITFSCIVDGTALRGIDGTLICSIFYNALDNAIESCENISDAEKRIISLNVSKMGDIAVITVQNYYTGSIEFQNGLPVPTGKDSDHGYGMKSMKMTVEKLGGNISINTDDNIFKLVLIIPTGKQKTQY